MQVESNEAERGWLTISEQLMHISFDALGEWEVDKRIDIGGTNLN
jgi:hypothetical protein